MKIYLFSRSAYPLEDYNEFIIEDLKKVSKLYRCSTCPFFQVSILTGSAVYH